MTSEIVTSKDERIDLTLRAIKRENNLNVLNFLKSIYGSTSELENEYKSIKTELLKSKLISEVDHGIFKLTLLGNIILSKGSYKDFINRKSRQDELISKYYSHGGFKTSKLRTCAQWLIIWIISIGLGALVYKTLSEL